MVKKSLAAVVSTQRVIIQGLLGALVFVASSVFGLSLWIILGLGAVTGLIFGKVFCRWICPLGFIMELVMGLGGPDGKFKQMYQYHKLGCPIAWVSGALNRFSLFKIRLDEKSCVDCGACDRACYISSLDPKKFSLFKAGMEHSSSAFSCSRCLSCVAACPTGSLHYTALPRKISYGAPKK